MKSSANEMQVGGAHYVSPIQHWDFVASRNIGYFEAQVIKYATRWPKKNGLQDLEKGRHFLAKLIELAPVYTARWAALSWLESVKGTLIANFDKFCQSVGVKCDRRDMALPFILTDDYLDANNVTGLSRVIIALAAEWEGDVALLKDALARFDELIAQEKAAAPGSGYVDQG